jgi:hypothetical protein
MNMHKKSKSLSALKPQITRHHKGASKVLVVDMSVDALIERIEICISVVVNT